MVDCTAGMHLLYFAAITLEIFPMRLALRTIAAFVLARIYEITGAANSPDAPE